MVTSIAALQWSASDINNQPVADYTADFALDTQYDYYLEGSYNDVNVRPLFLVVDNLYADQALTVRFGNITYPIIAFSRLTVPVPLRSMIVSITSTGVDQTNLTFSVENLNVADTINFTGIQSAGGSGNVKQPIDPLGNGNFPITISATDLNHIKKATITAGGTITLPLTTDANIGNGFIFEVWNDSTSTANVTIAPTAPDTCDLVTVAPGSKYALVSNGNGKWFNKQYAGGSGGIFIGAYTNVVVSTTFNFAHGLGAVPTSAQILLKCVTAQLGYAIGDVISLGPEGAAGSSQGSTIGYDATNAFVSLGNTINVIRKDTQVGAAITAANWQVSCVVRASS